MTTGAHDPPDGAERPRSLPADIATAFGLILVELLALALLFVVWALSGFDLNPDNPPSTHPVWGYLVGAGVLVVLMARSGLRASRRGAGVTATTQAVMAMGTVTLIVAAAYYQVREDTPPPPSPCLTSPSAPWCNG
ncbi:DUF6234 family protein [Streptomyces sp. NPDC006512]|uniref:DUF6234 family protein n=1 Tax=Streptomyces sp. NPDC006512 TaxID=3154307 RepID=UPI0033AFAF07